MSRGDLRLRVDNGRRRARARELNRQRTRRDGHAGNGAESQDGAGGPRGGRRVGVDKRRRRGERAGRMGLGQRGEDSRRAAALSALTSLDLAIANLADGLAGGRGRNRSRRWRDGRCASPKAVRWKYSGGDSC